MTALGRVVALVRELEGGGGDVAHGFCPAEGGVTEYDCRTEAEYASRSGEYRMLFDDLRGESLRALMDSLPPVPRRSAAAQRRRAEARRIADDGAPATAAGRRPNR